MCLNSLTELSYVSGLHNLAMPFDNQFALTLEVTKLVPLIGQAYNKTTNAILNSARELKNSGSDIIIEEDLTNVLGRCKISDGLSSSFRTVVGKSSSTIPLLEDIFLQAGPGPTVARSFKDKPHFAMLVQISFLTWTFGQVGLATALADALQNRYERAPSEAGLPVVPDRSGIIAVLGAIESQTSAFNWNMMLDAVSQTLGYNMRNHQHESPFPFAKFLFEPLLDMFPMVQTLPSDRFIHIQASPMSWKGGVSALVVWAHHILGLTVVVRRPSFSPQRSVNIRFGDTEVENVFIDETNVENEPLVALLDAAKEHLLTVKPNPDEDIELIHALRRRPLRSWATSMILDLLYVSNPIKEWPPGVMEELQTVAIAFTFIVAKKLVIDSGDELFEGTGDSAIGSVIYKINESYLIQAIQILFGAPHLHKGLAKSYILEYSNKSLDQRLTKPPSLQAQSISSVEVWESDHVWALVCPELKKLSVFAIALACVVDNESLENLISSNTNLTELNRHPLLRQLQKWDGLQNLAISRDAWFQVIAVYLLEVGGDPWSLLWERVCLISDGRWSAWIPSLGTSDPSYVSAGLIRIGQGSPCRRGVWKQGIWDNFCSRRPDLKG